LFTGESLSPNRYLAELGVVMPAIPGTAQGELHRPEDHWRMAGVDPLTPVFAAFRRPESGDLSLPLFKRRFTLEPTPGAHVSAHFIDGVPFVVTGEFGEGRVAFVNTTPDTAWTDWPQRRTFVPWIHSLAHWLHGSAEFNQGSEEIPTVAGGEAIVALGSDVAGAALRIDGPDGTSVGVEADELGRVILSLDQPGIYTVRHPTGEELRRLAVNLASVESDLSALTSGEFQDRLTRVASSTASGWVSGLLDPVGDEHHFWRLLLMTGAALLLIELFLANRTFA
jgi:hypothetical protein